MKFWFKITPLAVFLSLTSCKEETTVPPQNPSTYFAQVFGGSASDRVTSVVETPDGGLLVLGNTFSYGSGNSDIFAARLNSDGSVAWFKTYGGSGTDEAYSIVGTSDGSFVIAGYTNSFGASGVDVLTIKIGGDGNVIWSNYFRLPQDDYAVSIQEYTDGGFVLAGYSNFVPERNFDALLIKIHAGGNFEWGRVYGGVWNDFGSAVKVSGDGSLLLLGYGYSDEANGDINLMRIYGDGVLQWSKHYGGSGFDRAYDMQFTSDNGIIVSGHTKSFGLGSGDAYFFKTDANGFVYWSKTLGGADVDSAVSVRQTSDGGYIAAGTTSSFGTGTGDLFLIRLFGDGVFNWSSVIGGSFSDGCSYVIQKSSGDFALAGWTQSLGSGGDDAYVLTLRSNGTGCLPDNRILPSGGDPVTQVNNAATITNGIYTYETISASLSVAVISPQVSTQCTSGTD